VTLVGAQLLIRKIDCDTVHIEVSRINKHCAC
jgi:hypothetical protein